MTTIIDDSLEGIPIPEDISKCKLISFNTHINADKLIIDGRHILNLNKFPNIHELEISNVRGVDINCKMWHITKLKISRELSEFYSTRFLTMCGIGK